MTKECTDWVAIGQELNRIPSKCADKWRDLHASRMKKGPFAAEEDALMRQRVAEWEREGKPKGLWVSLQKEMDRRAQSIRMHWKIALATRALDWDRKENWEEWMFTPLLEREKSKFRWTKSMDARLIEGVAKHTEKESWVGVANFVGGSVTAMQCQQRWTDHIFYALKKDIRRGQWSDTEVAELTQLVPQQEIESHWSEEMGVVTKERTDWTAIANNLNRFPKDCMHKWRHMAYSMLPAGPITEEEKYLILKRVAEWGSKGNGLWVRLGQEMGRSPRHISRHWRNYLKKTRLEPKLYFSRLQLFVSSFSPELH